MVSISLLKIRMIKSQGYVPIAFYNGFNHLIRTHIEANIEDNKLKLWAMDINIEDLHCVIDVYGQPWYIIPSKYRAWECL